MNTEEVFEMMKSDKEINIHRSLSYRSITPRSSSTVDYRSESGQF